MYKDISYCNVLDLVDPPPPPSFEYSLKYKSAICLRKEMNNVKIIKVLSCQLW